MPYLRNVNETCPGYSLNFGSCKREFALPQCSLCACCSVPGYWELLRARQGVGMVREGTVRFRGCAYIAQGLQSPSLPAQVCGFSVSHQEDPLEMHFLPRPTQTVQGRVPRTLCCLRRSCRTALGKTHTHEAFPAGSGA